MLYGYARISNSKQNIDRQIRNIKAKYPDAVIVDEAFTGTTSSRPKWQRLFSHVKSGDQIVFDSVSRMSRNAEDGFRDYETLYYRGVELIFLKEPMIDTSTFRNATVVVCPPDRNECRSHSGGRKPISDGARAGTNTSGL